MANKVTVSHFAIVGGTDRTVRAEWTLSHNKIDWLKSYYVIWEYYVEGSGYKRGKVGDIGTITYDEYSAPSNATSVRFVVTAKVYHDTQTGNITSRDDRSVNSTTLSLNFSNAIELPSSLSKPSVTLENGYYVKASIESLSLFDNRSITFYLHRDNNGNAVNQASATISTGTASATFRIEAGHTYKIRYRIFAYDQYTVYSAYSDNVTTVPGSPGAITSIKALSDTSIQLIWNRATGAESYEVEYTTNKIYFDTSNETSRMTIDEGTKAIVTGLEPGNKYYFRVRSINNNGESEWTKNECSIVLGAVPSPPTTWSSTTTAVTGEQVKLYWTHNSEDASDQAAAMVECYIGATRHIWTIYGGVCNTIAGTTAKVVELSTSFALVTGAIVKVEMTYSNTIANPTLNVGGTGAKQITTSSGTSVYWNPGTVVVFKYDGSKWVIQENNAQANTTSITLATEYMTAGNIIKWRVKTMGILGVYSDYSVQRLVTVYAPPTLSLAVTNASGASVSTLTSFPINISASAGPSSQKPISYSLSIIACNSYETIDSFGNTTYVTKGEVVYSKYFDIKSTLSAKLTAGDVNLDNNVTYKIICKVAMNSGLTAESSRQFVVRWADVEYDPQLECVINQSSLTASLRPYCLTASGALVSDVTLSVYRREYDGRLTEIASGLTNSTNNYITDPHPALDGARYRVVAISKSTGSVSYNDIFGMGIAEKSTIIQWDEEWQNFETDWTDMFPVEPSWAGSMLKLPYNIDVSEQNDIDVSLVEYIGREHPVSYYGTQLGVSATWNMEVPKGDKATLFTLRRLQVWMGDVYVREPSGSGYWASIKVSFSQKHCETTIPVTLNITRVEGGV